MGWGVSADSSLAHVGDGGGVGAGGGGGALLTVHWWRWGCWVGGSTDSSLMEMGVLGGRQY